MTNTVCRGCIYADWHRDAKRRLHFKGTGHCTRLEEYPVDMKIPAAFHWPGGKEPAPFGGFITRHHEMERLCPFKVTEKTEGADLDSLIRAFEDAVVMVREADVDAQPRAALAYELARIALKAEYMRMKDAADNSE